MSVKRPGAPIIWRIVLGAGLAVALGGCMSTPVTDFSGPAGAAAAGEPLVLTKESGQGVALPAGAAEPAPIPAAAGPATVGPTPKLETTAMPPAPADTPAPAEAATAGAPNINVAPKEPEGTLLSPEGPIRVTDAL